ncbi:DUF7282 domain-containing protein [Maritalea myrionectae]|uniref:DUF7282 domain-containing protein n=1 Tax=Maritalea myrionectae TaxID=454601 RepID=UPI0003FCEC83|nr:hypothetical protein [Maritalea myrionectae]
MSFTKTIFTTAAAFALTATSALADGHSKIGVMAEDQDVSGGTVSAAEIVAGENGYLVVHRTGDDMKPGPVVGYSTIKKGMNEDITAILTEDVSAGDKLMLMIHSEAGGKETGVFEYTLGAKEDGPIRMDGDLVMTVISAK